MLPALASLAATNLALNCSVVASSTQSSVVAAAYAVDGDTSTRWGSEWSDNQWIYVDLGTSKSITGVTLRWEGAYASAYNIQLSDDAVTWTDGASVTNGVGGVENVTVSGTCRYVRLYSVTRATGYGISLYEFEVYNAATSDSTVDLAQGKSATASSVENDSANYVASMAVDGNDTTRWSSAASDPQWIRVDLGQTYSIGKVALHWESAYASSYSIQGSNDDSTYTTLASVTSGTGGIDNVTVSGTWLYIRMYGTARGTGYGYSLYSFSVYAPATDLAQGKSVTASSVEDNYLGYAPSMAVDGDNTTRWSSAASDPQWIRVDLGNACNIAQVSLLWESAYATAYSVQGSNDDSTYTTLASVTSGTGGRNTLAVSGTWRYIRMYGTARANGYGYSLYSFNVYSSDFYTTGTSTSGTSTVPVQTTNQTVNLTFPVQGVAYATVNVSPTPLSMVPTPSDGDSIPSVRNPTSAVTYQLTFPANTYVTISKNQFTGSDPNTDIVLSTVDYTGTTLTGSSVTTLAVDSSTWNVVVVSTGSSTSSSGTANWISDPYTAPAAPSTSGVFAISGPTNSTVVTTTRRPTLVWAASPGAVKYDVYLNISRTDYDWAAAGNLLDRYTLMGSVTSGSSYTLQQDLSDRWTYKWYVVATAASGTTSQSDVGTFSVYIPTLTTVNDGLSIINGCRDLNKDGVIEPYEDWHNSPAVRVADLMSRMTTHQKAMQLYFNTQYYSEAGFGFGPFSLDDLLSFQKAASATALGIPFIELADTIHGYKTSYPTQPGLAATRDLQTAWEVADMQRRESLAVGNRGTLSPLAEVGTKVLYPRIQEGCGEDAELAAGMVRAMVVGLQGGPEVNPQSMMITVKHWAGQGAGGESGVVYDGTTIWYHMRPWHAAIEAGVSSIMPGYGGSWLLATEGYGAGDDPGILSFLRNTMGYQGVICTDWLPSGSWTRACSNGSDVMGGADPGVMGTFETDVPSSRIDDAVRRVLDLKFRMGIFEDPYGNNPSGTALWHTAKNAQLAHDAAVQSVTLLKNDGALPLRLTAGSSIVVDGPRADDPSCMVTWRSDFHENDYGCKTIYNAIVARAAKDSITVYGPSARTANPVPSGVTPSAAIVVVGESYYTHGTAWDKNSPFLPDDPIGTAHDTTDAPQYALIQKYRNLGIPTTVICMLPRPYVLTNVNALANALMVVYRPGDEGGVAIAETLFGDYSPMGKTPWQLPSSTSQIGIDDSANWQSQPDHWDLPYDMGASASDIAAIRAAIAAGEHVSPIYGSPLFQYGSGIQGFGLSDATPPLAFNLVTPSNGNQVTGALPTFTWGSSSDPETGIQRYELYLDSALLTTTSSKVTSYTLSGTSIGNGTYSWYVKAYNWAGGSTSSATYTFSISDTTAPNAFKAMLPVNGATVSGTDTIDFYWEQSSDAGTGLANYQLLLDGTVAATVTPSTYVSSTTNLALGKVVYPSSTGYGEASYAVDGDLTTRWASDYTTVATPDAEWFTVDLGTVYSIKEVVIHWEAAYGKSYLIQVSTDNTNWTTIYRKTDGQGGIDDITSLNGAGRYVRMQGVTRGSSYGYSIYEFQVYGLGTEKATVPVASGTHTWQVQVYDGAGNCTTNNNGTQSLVR
ncbi:MAG: discoidin domain-containing protein [Chthoniobacteraceae bacterium]